MIRTSQFLNLKKNFYKEVLNIEELSHEARCAPTIDASKRLLETS